MNSHPKTRVTEDGIEDAVSAVAKKSEVGVQPIKSHRQLAHAIAGKTLLHTFSLGKDSLLTLAWCSMYAHPGKIYSLFFQRFTMHPEEHRYFEYVKAKFPKVTFLVLPDPNEITMIMQGIYQSPERQALIESFEHDAIYREGILAELIDELHIDFVVDGQSAAEGMGRAQKFHGKGLLIDDTIYPIGLMKKSEIIDLIRKLKLKLNPTYKFYGSTFDEITYYRMRSAMNASPQFTELLYRYFPQLKADRFRWEVVNAEVAKENRR